MQAHRRDTPWARGWRSTMEKTSTRVKYRKFTSGWYGAKRSFIVYSSFSGGIAATDIIAQITGIAPLDYIAAFQLVAGAAVVGLPVVDTVHPDGEIAAVELVQVVDALDVGAVVDRRPGRFHMDPVVPAHTLQHIKNRLPLVEGDDGGGQDHAVGRDELHLVGMQTFHVAEDGGALDGKGAGAGLLPV